jgi:hypothetical protein
MDQLKTFLAAVKKHHFWILCGLSCLVGLGMVYGASGKLLKAYDSKKSDISGVERKLADYTGGSDHPNENWVKAVKGKTEDFRRKVYDAWVKLYEQQRINFFWPKDLGKGQEFYDAFKVDPAPVPPFKMAELSELYQTYVTSTILPGMAKIVDADWTGRPDRDAQAQPRFQGRPGARGAVAARPDEATQAEHAVVWDQADQTRMYELYTWEDQPPREIEIRYAQEEMWVLKAIFDSIARANNGARIPNDAVVRVIQEAVIGYDAAEKSPLGEGANRIVRLHLANSPVAGPMASAGPIATDSSAPVFVDARRPGRSGRRPGGSDSSSPRGRRFGPTLPGPTPPSGSDVSTDPDAALKNARYVDSKGRPLAAAGAGSESSSSTTPAEYRLMAFRLVLVCDEARFQTVVAELANSIMPLEVREVRINVSRESTNDGSRGPRGRDASRPSGRPSAAGNGADEGTVMHNATIEIHGLAYLVNPPDPKKVWPSSEVPPGLAATTGPATTGTATTGTEPGAGAAATTGTAAPGTGATDNGATSTSTPPAATTGTADAAPTPATSGKSGAAPAAETATDKGAAPVESGGGAATKTGPGAADTATPPGK